MRTDPTAARVFAALDRLAGDLPGLGIALSGGGDSMALMHLAARWGAARGRRIAAATVDHGLREASRAEAVAAGQAAAALGLPHSILSWDGAGQGNLMDRARRARLRLLSDWARGQGLPAVALGHTRDDQAETLLMRLARGAGIDGLAAMADRRQDRGVIWLRPLLDLGRADLRDWLRHIGADWVEDPTNDDLRFDRARIRQGMAQLGLDSAALALSAGHLAAAREVLNAATLPLLEGAEARMGSVLLDRSRFDAAPGELRRRLILAAVRFVTGADYPPRRAGVNHALQALAQGQRVTLDGAVLDPRDCLLVHREPAAAGRAGPGLPWDNRWNISGLVGGDALRPLGPDASGVDWRAAGLTHLEAQALPAITRAGRVICPALEPWAGMSAQPIRDMIGFRRILLGH